MEVKPGRRKTMGVRREGEGARKRKRERERKTGELRFTMPMLSSNCNPSGRKPPDGPGVMARPLSIL
jgi:hypothetical protein